MIVLGAWLLSKLTGLHKGEFKSTAPPRPTPANRGYASLSAASLEEPSRSPFVSPGSDAHVDDSMTD